MRSLDLRGDSAKHRDSMAERRVRLFADDHGMATVWASKRADAAAG